MAVGELGGGFALVASMAWDLPAKRAQGYEPPGAGPQCHGIRRGQTGSGQNDTQDLSELDGAIRGLGRLD